MKNKSLLALVAVPLIGVSMAASVAFAGVETPPSTEPVENEVPITGNALAKASAVALAHTGDGRVTGTELGDEESYYEIEVTLADNRQVDVQLDESFKFVGEKVDNETEVLP